LALARRIKREMSLHFTLIRDDANIEVE
jgi:hypothetical protein